MTLPPVLQRCLEASGSAGGRNQHVLVPCAFQSGCRLGSEPARLDPQVLGNAVEAFWRFCGNRHKLIADSTITCFASA